MDRYYYGEQINNFIFYRVPKALFSDENYKSLSTDAKVLYGLMLDRMVLSTRNEWKDKNGRVYIYYPVDEIMDEMGCCKQKAVNLLDEMEKTADLIERKKQGMGKPNRIYVKRLDVAAPQFEKDTSGSAKMTLDKYEKWTT